MRVCHEPAKTSEGPAINLHTLLLHEQCPTSFEDISDTPSKSIELQTDPQTKSLPPTFYTLLPRPRPSSRTRRRSRSRSTILPLLSLKTRRTPLHLRLFIA